MAKILGLDLGSSSIGWALVDYIDNPENNMKIIGIGSRVVPIDGDTLSKFNSGQQISINANRTLMRTARKTFDRYALRRSALINFFGDKGIKIPQSLMTLGREDLWRLRSEAVTRPLTPEELARVLYLLNQKRGYKATKADLDPDNKEIAGLVSIVRTHYAMLKEADVTIGQWGYSNLLRNPDFRIKGEVFPRAAYIEEFDKIMEVQRQYMPELLSDDNIKTLRNRIIFYQRPLKSCKHLVSPCEIEQFTVTDAQGREIKVGPKVTQRSNPLFQVFRIWQSVNNIILTNRHNEKMYLSIEQKRMLVDFLLTHDKLTVSNFNELIFGKKRQNVWFLDDNVGKGIPGDKTRLALKKALGNKYSELLRLNLPESSTVDKTTGEILPIINAEVSNSPICQLWHCIYSIPEKEHLWATLKNHFGIEDESVLEALSNVDFVKDGYANLSVKAIRRVLPFLMQGMVYSDACNAVGIRHSDYLTAEENEQRTLAKSLPLLKKGELRQPIVEKILNQMVNLVNTIIEHHGPVDEIVVELARELQQSREERSDTSKRIKENEKNNQRIAGLIKEYGLYPTRSRIVKYKLWEESGKQCIYCGANVGIKDFLIGYDAEVEHIVPKSLLFDDSFSNKACSCRKCNHDKGNATAKDFMLAKGETFYNEYVDRVNQLKESHTISNTKFNNLMRNASELPRDFISRQLRESQYISRKAMEMLRTVCRTVRATSGSVTDYLRHVWGWDQVLHNLNLEFRRLEGATEIVEIEHRDSNDVKERIKGWSKRLDHRHHALDALTIACTTQALIQRLNNLSSLAGESWRDFNKLPETQKKRHSLLERYALAMPHFTTQQVAEEIGRVMVSFKPITKLTSPGKRYIKRHNQRETVQTGLAVPRGRLHEETVYGSISVPDAKYGSRKEIVVKYPLSSFKSVKEAESIVDKAIRQLVVERLQLCNGNAKEAFSKPLYSDAAHTKEINSVRCFTGLTKVVPIRFDSEGTNIGFAKPASNHHVAIYEDAEGKLHEHVATFFHCIERHRRGLPAIVSDPDAMWDEILERKEDLPDDFLEQLPRPNWKLRFTMQRNEMFVLGMNDEEFNLAVETGDMTHLAQHLYKVQRLAQGQYYFCRHTETDITEMQRLANKPGGRFYRFSSVNSFQKMHPRKVKVNCLGEISLRC